GRGCHVPKSRGRSRGTQPPEYASSFRSVAGEPSSGINRESRTRPMLHKTTNLGVRSSNLFGRATPIGTSHTSPYLSWESNKVNKVLAAQRVRPRILSSKIFLPRVLELKLCMASLIL